MVRHPGLIEANLQCNPTTCVFMYMLSVYWPIPIAMGNRSETEKGRQLTFATLACNLCVMVFLQVFLTIINYLLVFFFFPSFSRLRFGKLAC